MAASSGVTPGKSVGGTTEATARIMKDNSAMTRRGAGGKNLGPSRAARPSQAPVIRSLAGRAINGPDKGAGTS